MLSMLQENGQTKRNVGNRNVLLVSKNILKKATSEFKQLFESMFCEKN